MPTIKTVLPSYLGGKRILMRGCENFGPGSYDPYRALHIGVVTGKSILPCSFHTTAITGSDDGITDATVSPKRIYTGIPLNIYEN